MSFASEEAAYAAIQDDTGIDAQEWRDARSLRPADFAQTMADWHTLGRMSWTKEPSTLDRVVSALTFLAGLANPVSAIAGGVTGLAAMINAIKGV